MARYVAFLRGMNIGGRRIKNPELVAIFKDLGCTDVGAFLASGNVVFSAEATSPEALQSMLEEGLEAALGYSVTTFVREAQATRAVSAARPFTEAELASAGKPQVMFLKAAPSAEAAAIVEALDTPDDRLVIDGAELYWLPSGGLSSSTLDLKTIERTIGPTTTRTHRTVTRLSAKFLD